MTWPCLPVALIIDERVLHALNNGVQVLFGCFEDCDVFDKVSIQNQQSTAKPCRNWTT
jgi:hypothetical protein